MITFRVDEYLIRGGGQVIEIRDGDRFMGAIYAQEWGIRIVSRYMEEDRILFDGAIPPVLEVHLP